MEIDFSKPIGNETPADQRDSKGRFLPGHNIGEKFKPGQSGNPKGRKPNELCITSILRKKLEENEGAGYEEIVESILSVLKNLDDRASASMLKDIMDRLEGKAPDVLTITPDSKITFNVRYEGEEKETEVPT